MVNNTTMEKGDTKLTREKKTEKQKKYAEQNTQQENNTRRRKLLRDLNTFKEQADKNGNARNSLISIFDELINDTNFKGSSIKIFNTLDAGTRNIIYHNQDLMKTVLDDMFKVNEGEQLIEEQSIQVNEFLKNLQEDLEKSDCNLIKHPENDDAIDWLIEQFESKLKESSLKQDKTNKFETNLNAVKRLIEYQKIRRELLRNNLYYKKPERTTIQQEEGEQKPKTPTLESFIENAKTKEDVKQVDELIKSVKFENFGDLYDIMDVYAKHINEVRNNTEKIERDDIIIDYMNNLDKEELRRFVNNTILNGINVEGELETDLKNFLSLIGGNIDQIDNKVKDIVVSCLITNVDVYNSVLKNGGLSGIVELVKKYHDAQLIERDERTVLEELALSGDENSISELKNKIENGEELTESMKDMLLLYSNKNNKYTKDNRKAFKKGLDKQTKEMEKNIKSNNEKIKKIDDDIKDKSKIIQKNEEELRKKQEELNTKYNKNKAGLFGKINFEKKIKKLRYETDTLRNQIENDRKYISDQEREKERIKTNNTQLNNKIQQIRKYRDNKNNEQLQDLYELNYDVEDFKKQTKDMPFSEIINLLENEDDKVQAAIINSYCKNVDELSDEEFEELLDYCIKKKGSLGVEGSVKEPLDVLLEKDSLKKFSDDRVYDLLHNEKLKDKTESILNNLQDNKLSALISNAVEQIEDDTEIEDEEKRKLMEVEKERDREIINTLNNVEKINKLQQDGKFKTINTLIDYAKTGFNREDLEQSDDNKIGIMNNIVFGLSVEKIDETKPQEEIDKQKENNEQAIQTLKRVYEIYGDNGQTQQQNEIIEKFTDSIEDLADTPELLSEVIDFAEENLENNKKSTKKEKEEEQKENTEKTINLLNTVVEKVKINKIQDGVSQEEINKQKENNKQTIQTLKRVYEIYGDNEQTQQQNEIIEKFTNSVGNLIDTPELLSEVIDFADSLYDEEKEDKKEEEKKAELLEDKEFEGQIFDNLNTEINAINNKPENETEEEKRKREKLNEENKKKVIEELDKQIKELEGNNKNIDDDNKKIDENITKIKKETTTIKEIIELKKQLETIEKNNSKGTRVEELKKQEIQKQIIEKYKTIKGIDNNSSIDDLTKRIETLNSEIKEEEEKKTNELKSKEGNNKKIEKLKKIKEAISKGDVNELKSLQMEQAQLLDNIDKQIEENEEKKTNREKIDAEKQTRKERKNKINKEIIDKTVIPEVKEKPTEKELQDVQDKIKLLVKISKNNKDLVEDIQNKIKEPINKLIQNKQIDTVLKIASESGNLIKCLDSETVNGIYDKIKDRKFGSNSLNNKYLADTLIQIYNSYDEAGDKKEQKEKILKTLLFLTPESLVSCIQNNEICDDLLLKLIERKPNLLNNIEVDSKNEKIAQQTNKILSNSNINVKTETQTKLQEFTKQYENKKQEIIKQQQAQQQAQQQNNQQQNNQQQNNQQQNQTQQSNSTTQNNGQQQTTNQQENQSSKQTNNPFSTFVDFFTKPQEFMKDCSKNPVKMMELMMVMNTMSGNGVYPFYQQGKMSEKQYNKYLENPNEFMEKFINDPMKFVGMMGSSSDKLQKCFTAYLSSNDNKFPEGVTMALCKVASYLNNAQQMMCYRGGYTMPNQAMMYGGGYGVPYGVAFAQPGNIALPSTFYATAVSQMKYEQECLSELRKQNKIAKEKLELKKQEVAEMKRTNDIAELKQIGKLFSSTEIKSEEVKDSGKVKITYTGPSGEKKYEISIE